MYDMISVSNSRGDTKMTKRQKALGVTEHGLERGIAKGEFLADNEAFLAKAATIKIGQYKGIDIVKQWFGFESYTKLEQMQPFLFGLTAKYPKYFNYTDTHGLDLLTVRGLN
jgi:hypothetical protein